MSPGKLVQCIITTDDNYFLSETHVLVTVQSCKILCLFFSHRLITAALGQGGYLVAPQLSLVALNRTAFSSVLLQGRLLSL